MAVSQEAVQAVKLVVAAKEAWWEAEARGDQAGKEQAHRDAVLARDWLRSLGYGWAADALDQVDVGGARALLANMEAELSSLPTGTPSSAAGGSTQTSGGAPAGDQVGAVAAGTGVTPTGGSAPTPTTNAPGASSGDNKPTVWDWLRTVLFDPGGWIKVATGGGPNVAGSTTTQASPAASGMGTAAPPSNVPSTPAQTVAEAARAVTGASRAVTGALTQTASVLSGIVTTLARLLPYIVGFLAVVFVGRALGSVAKAVGLKGGRSRR